MSSQAICIHAADNFMIYRELFFLLSNLATSSGRLYPDFVCELADGRVLVAWYKGSHPRAVPKEIEKGQAGRISAERSAGRAVFAMLYKVQQGMGLTSQINAALA